MDGLLLGRCTSLLGEDSASAARRLLDGLRLIVRLFIINASLWFRAVVFA